MADERFGQGMIKDGAQKISDQDIKKVVDRSEEIQRRFSSGGPLRRFVDDGRLLISAVRDYWAGRYRRLPVGTLGAMAFTLLYVLNPLDIFPDVIPIVGQVDDAAVVAGCLLLVEHDLRGYGIWKQQQIARPELPDKTPPSQG